MCSWLCSYFFFFFLKKICYSVEVAFQKLSNGTLPPEFIEAVRYKGEGFATFVQGSQIVHRVTPVVFAEEPRISVINSYNPLGMQKS